MPSKKTYLQRKNAGICVQCGKNQARPGKTSCVSCAEHLAEEYQIYKKYNICVVCHHEEALPGRRACYACLEKDLEYANRKFQNASSEEKEKYNAAVRRRRREKMEAGLCTKCGKPLPDRKYSLCLSCRIYFRRWNQENRTPHNYMRLGLCRWCGKETVEGKAYCSEHLIQMQDLMAKNRRSPENNHYWKQLNNAQFSKRKQCIQEELKL